MSQARISVVGSYGVGLTFGLSRVPAAGETVTGHYFRVDHGGKGSNQAVGAARLGAQVRLRTAVGDDTFGETARRLWSDEGVTASVLVAPGVATMAGAILVEDGGENRIVIAPGALEHLGPDDLDPRADVEGADVLVVQLEIPLTTAARAVRLGKAAGVRTLLNPAPAPRGGALPEGLLDADVLTPNLHEARALLGGGAGLDHPAAAARLAEQTGAQVVLTAGAEGAYVAAGGLVEHVAAVPVDDVVDTTGAGDAFTAALAVLLAEGADLVEAARFAGRAAAHCVRHHGVIPGLPRRADLGAPSRPEQA
jgi:ribokinase